MRNGNFIPLKYTGKGKRIHIYAYFDENQETMNYTKHPYLQVEPSNSNQNLYKCGLYQISKISQKFIAEGKITIDVVEGEQVSNIQGCDNSNKQTLEKKMAHLILNDSTQQSLKLLISKITNIIQIYAEKSKKPQQNVSKTQQQQQIDKTAQQEQQKNQFQFKPDKKVSINEMKINVQQPQQQNKEKSRELIFRDVVEVDKQLIGANVSKKFNKIDKQNFFSQQNKIANKQQTQSSNLDKKDKNLKQKKKEKVNRVEDIILEMQSDDDEKEEQQVIQDVNKLIQNNEILMELDECIEIQNENKTKQIKPQNEQIQIKTLQPISSQKFTEQSQFLQVNNNDSIKSSNLLSPSINQSSNLLSPSISKSSNFLSPSIGQSSNILSPSMGQSNSLLSPQMCKSSKMNSPSTSKSSRGLEQETGSQEILKQKESLIQQEKLKQLSRESFQKEKEKENLARQILSEEDKLIYEKKKLLHQEQLIIFEKQIQLNQQEKMIKKQQILQLMEEQEESLNQEEILLMKQKEKLENQIKEMDENSRESSSNITFQKYFQEKKNIVSQYENEQRQIQNENEKIIEATKFVSLQSKIQELKTKQQIKNAQQSNQAIPQQKKNLYIVDRSITKQSLNNNGQQTLALKRRNPFSYDDEDNDINNSNDIYTEIINTRNNMDKQNKSPFQVDDDDDNNQNENINNQINKNNQINISKLFKLKEGNTPADLPHQFQSVKKLGNKFIFEKSSIPIKKIDTSQQQQDTEKSKSMPQNREKRILKLSQESSSQSQDKKKEISQIVNVNIQQLLILLPEHVISHIFIFIAKKQLFQIRIVSKFFNNAIFLSIKKLTFNKRETPSERVIQMLNKSKYLTHLQIGTLTNLKADAVLEKVDLSQIKSLQVIDFSNYQNLTYKLFIEFLKSSKQIRDISLPFFGRITDEQLMQLHGYLNNLKRIAIKSILDTFDKNEKIGDVSLAKMITANKNMSIFEIYTTSPYLFDKIEQYEVLKKEKYEENNTEQRKSFIIEDYDDSYSRMECFKIRNLVMSRFVEDDLTKIEKNLITISKFKNLKTLKLVNIVKKSKGQWFLPYTLTMNTIGTIFKNCKKIQELCLGQWCTNDTLLKISQELKYLIKIRLIGKQVDDTGLEYILQKMEQLEIINIVEATSINGHCFESTISRNIKEIKVKFDDFRLNCLHSIVTHQLQLFGIKITNYTN